MKRFVALAVLAACRTTQDEPKPPPPQPSLSSPTGPAPAPPPASPSSTAPQPIAGVMPVTGDFKIKDFAFAGGEKLPELRIHYMTLGTVRRDAAGHATNAV